MVFRFITTVLLGTVLHAVATIIIPPFEFGPTRVVGFFWAIRSGIIVFPILFAVLLLPLRAALHYFMPQTDRRAHTIAAALVLYALPASITLVRQLSGVPAKPYEHGYPSQWIFWAVFAIAIAISFFGRLAHETLFKQIQILARLIKEKKRGWIAPASSVHSRFLDRLPVCSGK